MKTTSSRVAVTRAAVLACASLLLLQCSSPLDDPSEVENSTAAATTPTPIHPQLGPNKCMDVSWASRDNGARVQLWDCNGGPNQSWAYEGGQLRVYGNMCLDVVDGVNANGTRLQIWNCTPGNPNQQFVRSGLNWVWAGRNKCIDLPWGDTRAGNFLQVWDCVGNTYQQWSGPSSPPPPPPPPPGGGFERLLSRGTFEAMFPNRNGFYTYDGLVEGAKKYAAFGTVGDDANRKREIAAFLANANHETAGLIYIEEIARNEYCAPGAAGCPCAPGKRYYGRGPIQLSWNYNYCAASLSIFGNQEVLRTDPDKVARESWLAWATGLYFWMNSTGAGSMTCHNAMVNGSNFGETIRTINGGLECNGGNPGQVQSRIDAYRRFCGMLGVDPGTRLGC